MEPRLKSEFWVQAQLRKLDQDCIPAVISRRGDPDAGAIYIKLIHARDLVVVLSPSRTAEGERAWLQGTGAEPVIEPEADAYLARQADFDPDIWVIEVEDPKHQYRLDAPILT